GHKIDDKFTGSADVVEGVFRVSINCADAGTEQDGGRSGADGVEKAERREVRLAGGVNGADPGNRTRHDGGGKQFVDFAVGIFIRDDVHSSYSLSRNGQMVARFPAGSPLRVLLKYGLMSRVAEGTAS